MTFSIVLPEAEESAYGLDNSRVIMPYQVDWDERFDARDALLGENFFMTGDPGHSVPGQSYFISREIPHYLPYLPEKMISLLNSEVLWANAITSMKGVAPNGTFQGLPQFEFCRMSVAYEFMPYDVHPDISVKGILGFPDESLLRRFVSKETTDASRFLSFRSGSWRYLTGPSSETTPARTVAQEVPHLLPLTEITYIWHHVPFQGVPFSTYTSLKNKTNDAVFDGYEPHTLVFAGESLKQRRQYNGIKTVDVHLKVKHYPLGANHWPDPQDNNRFQQIGRVVGVQTFYPHDPADFRRLFWPYPG